MTLATVEVLENLARSPERFPGALLLTGPSQARLERESRRLAARLLCPGDDPEAQCGSCRRVESGLHPDFLSVEPEGVQIRVDRVREALVFAAGRPYESPRRVARVLHADRIGVEGANALLKALEEPGARMRWILCTAHPESLLATIRSRCTPVILPTPAPSERQAAWRGRGFSEEDARDLALFAREEDEEPEPAERLARGRELRQAAVAALEEGLGAGRLTALLLLAEQSGSQEPLARLVAELLADAALAAHGPSSEALRHAPVGGKLAEIAHRVGAGPLSEAAVLAADPPPDIRRGNRRMHYEKLLIGLFEARRK